MHILKFLFLLSISILLSCTEKKTNTYADLEDVVVLKYDEAKNIDFDYSHLFDSVEIVQLDTIGDFLLRDDIRIKYALERFFVTDRSHRLFIFDRAGKPLLIIDHLGEGPNEYHSLRGFDISTEDSLICLQAYPAKLMWYDLKGNLVRQQKTDRQGFDIALLENQVALYTQNNKSDNQTYHLLDYFDRKSGHSQMKISGYPFLNGVLLPVYQHSSVFARLSDGSVLFNEPLSNYIYTLTDEDIRVKYVLDFGSKNPPDKDKVPILQDHSMSIEHIAKHYPVHGYNGCWENEHYFFIEMQLPENKGQRQMSVAGISQI